MRLLLVTLILGLLAASASADILVPSTHRYVESVSGQDTTWVEVDVTDVQQAIDLSYELINDDYAGYPGHDETVLLSAGRYDSVSTFTTVFGVKTAVASLRDGVTLRGQDREDVLIDQTESEYGVLCQDVGPATSVENLTITGGSDRDRGRVDDDPRDLVAGVACLEGAFATIRDVSIEGAATGIVVNTLHGEAAPAVEGVLIARGSHHGIYIQENGDTPVTIHETTIVQNFDVGVYIFDGSAAITNACITHNGLQGIKSYLVVPTVENCNLFWNDRDSDEPQNYGGNLTDLTGIDGNISEEPFYCDFFGNLGYIYFVCAASPNVPPQSTVGQIGAFGVGCQDCEAPVSQASWGAIKALYR
jgi:hypothetical protein